MANCETVGGAGDLCRSADDSVERRRCNFSDLTRVGTRIGEVVDFLNECSAAFLMQKATFHYEPF
ncbi:MAG: hypothetical protein Aurels2KO_56960 [Aureliella sp.]